MILELFDRFSLSDIIVCVFLVGFSIKSFVTFWDWAAFRLNKIFKKGLSKKELDAKVNELYHTKEQLYNVIDTINGKLNLLMDSDRDRMKAWIIEKHHFFCYEQKWIDKYTLDGIERVYERYKAEGGNTYVDKLIDEIRSLPNKTPEQ